jgi:ferredoxin
MIRKLLLTYDSSRASEPVLASVIKETSLLLNVLHAKINSQGGEIIVSVEVTDDQFPKLLELFRSKGVGAEELKKVIVLNRDSCIDCGACLSLCPTGALHFTPELKVELKEEKCVYCKLCIEACPVRALALSELE